MSTSPPVGPARRTGARWMVIALGTCGAACSLWQPETTSASSSPEVQSVFRVVQDPRAQAFLDVPWPSDITTQDNGVRDLATFPNPTRSSVVDHYISLLSAGRGWGLNGAIYLRFTAPLDETTLPADPASSALADASVQLLDIDERSPERGTRYPLRLRFTVQDGLFVPANTLVAIPVLGFPLRPATTYALLVRPTVKGMRGGEVGPSPDLVEVLKDQVPRRTDLARAHAAFAPLRRYGLAVGDIVHATVFTTQDPWLDMDGAQVRVQQGAPYAVSGWTRPEDHASHPNYLVYEGFIDLPQFQKGQPPFSFADGVNGGFELDEQGIPRVQRMEAVRFALTVPRGVPPPDGWPLVVLAHGTGGDYRTGIGDRYGDEAEWLARAGCASVMVSQPLHRTRQGFREGQEEVLTFNFLNPRAALDLWRQSALESAAQLESLVNLAVPAEIAAGGVPHRFRANQRLFFGHSQGGLTGALLIGIQGNLDVGILSGAGGGFAESLLDKSQPVSMVGVMRTVLNLPDQEALDPFHPLLSLIQMMSEVAEPLNAARRYFGQRRPPNVLILSGLQDGFTPPRTHGPLAAAAAIPLMAPQASLVEALELRGLQVQPTPVRANMGWGEEAATAVLAQFPDDGHFAIYRNPTATDLASHFVTSFLQDGVSEAVR